MPKTFNGANCNPISLPRRESYTTVSIRHSRDGQVLRSSVESLPPVDATAEDYSLKNLIQSGIDPASVSGSPIVSRLDDAQTLLDLSDSLHLND